ncbi:hypothetical protein [Salinivirga cyanobacteriivorans]|uniref:Uncharacterized protein n=1 Tax=Salinivirga cyanobacteriivorans TaxID=1307839 RepID=A0A0S2I5G2_9BACT|nr:hypothetical protein [Salinivirga cyanobacteriivorans]ALO17518.1 hypothetical protein L21SP5_03927 [Salinivirga cyanobacteriivorans]
MNQVISQLYALLEKHALINDEVSGFRFLSSPDFATERHKFYADLEEHFSLHNQQEELNGICNLPQLIRFLQKSKSAFEA